MKEIKDVILEKRIKNLEIEGKQVPAKYISVFNSYLEEIAESLAEHDKQVRKQVCEEIREKAYDLFCDDTIGWLTREEMFLEYLEQLQGENNGNTNNN